MGLARSTDAACCSWSRPFRSSLFIRIEQRAEQPIVPLHLFRIHTIATAAVVNFFIGVGMMGVFVYLQFYLQVGIGVDAATAGLVMGTDDPRLGRGVRRHPGQIMSRTGRYKILAVVRFADDARLDAPALDHDSRDHHSSAFSAACSSSAPAWDLMMPVMSIASQNAAPQKFLGIVSAFTQFFQQVGGVIGIGVIGALFNARLASGLMERLSPDLVGRIQPEKLVDPLFREGLVEDLGTEVWAVAEPQVQSAVATAITDNFLLAAGIVLISVLAILRMKEIRLRSAELPPAVTSSDRIRTHRASDTERD